MKVVSSVIMNNLKTNIIFLMYIEYIKIVSVKWLPNCFNSYLSFIS